MLCRTSSPQPSRSRALLLCVVVALSSCAPSGARAPLTPPKSSSNVRYDVRVHADGTLDVSLVLDVDTALTLDDGMEGFVSDLRVGDRAIALPAWDGATLTLDGAATSACARGCTVKYRFDLASAARTADDPAFAKISSGTYVTCPSAWILRPAHVADDAKFELAVDVDASIDFAFGAPSEAGSKKIYKGLLADLDEPPYAALGTFRRLAVDDVGPLEVIVTGPTPEMGDEGLAHWTREAVRNLRTIYPGYPAHHVLLVVQVEPGGRVGPATTMGNGGASIEVHIGASATAVNTGDDWILTHEMLHTTFPGLARTHHWAEEGMATYLEPIARARRGVIPVERVWAEWYQSMHLGEPFEDDQGLDQTASWGRTYWGGALFWFLSDVGIRKATANARGAPDFFAAIYRQADIAQRWPISRLISASDEASGSDVVAALYATHATHPVKVDLDRLFRDLGVSMRDGQIELDDSAPLAGIRKAIVTGPPKP